MKKRLVPALVCVLFLTGCSTVPQEIAVSGVGAEYTITVGVPGDAVEVPTEAGKLYRHEGGEYEISTTAFASDHVFAAVEYLTGSQNPTELTEHTRFGLPEYRVQWLNEKENTRCHADFVLDNGICYAVVFQVQTDRADAYVPLVTEVFSTFGLHVDEGV